MVVLTTLGLLFMLLLGLSLAAVLVLTYFYLGVTVAESLKWSHTSDRNGVIFVTIWLAIPFVIAGMADILRS